MLPGEAVRESAVTAVHGDSAGVVPAKALFLQLPSEELPLYAGISFAL